MFNLFKVIQEKIEWKKEANYIDNKIRYSEREWFFQQTFDYLKCRNQLIGDYYEFGCHKAMTFRMALREAKKRNINWMNFYAFDSFDGLPVLSGIDNDPIWNAGDFKTSKESFLNLIKKQKILKDKVKIIEGYYNQSLTKNLQKELLLNKSQIAIAFIDCDLYQSTKEVLHFIDPLLQKGSIIYFDDFYMFQGSPKKGEQLAFSEFIKTSQHSFEPHLSVGWFGKSFITV